MKRIALASAAALVALTGVASAQSATQLTSAAQVTLSTLAPNLDTDSLSPIQVSQLNGAVDSDNGLTAAQIKTIVAR
ncbi:hypothetical protein [Falsirhodobacter xinxiangensis]|uniref:hypothetical protein n=1 Tax=Falsirhodobacter xinxiangensis TaxID=2530049 RepID=UPI0010A9D78B|nr:hypothetical protein [Rhodobacter xinxiangensis]